jgi:hypothetical protein
MLSPDLFLCKNLHRQRQPKISVCLFLAYVIYFRQSEPEVLLSKGCFDILQRSMEEYAHKKGEVVGPAGGETGGPRCLAEVR